VEKELFEDIVVVVTTLPLDEMLRRDRVAAVKPEFECMLAFGPIDVLHELIGILNGELRSARIRPDLQAQVIVELNVRKSIHARELVPRNRVELAETVVGKSQLVRYARTERVVFGNRSQ